MWSNAHSYKISIRWDGNRYHQQCSQSLVVKSGTINLSLRQGTKPAVRQWRIKENHSIKSKLARNCMMKNISHVNITKSIICHSFIHWTRFVVYLLIKCYCYTNPFVPRCNLEAKSMVPNLATRLSEHCWWSFFNEKDNGMQWNWLRIERLIFPIKPNDLRIDLTGNDHI